MPTRMQILPKVPYVPPTRPCGKWVCGFLPINPTHAQESRDKQATFLRITLTRLSIHREGHRNEKAKRHRAGAARQSKLRAARKWLALHLEESKQQGWRAAFLQDSHLHSPTCPGFPAAHLDTPRIQKPPPPQFSHSYRNIHRALTLCASIMLNTFHEFLFNSHNALLTQAFPSALTDWGN